MANRTVLVRLQANAASYIAAMKAAKAATGDLLGEIDKTNDRTAWLAQGILAVAPAATTLGAAAVPVLSTMATQMTVAAGAAGVMAMGFNGVGDALGALNEYQLDPSAENLEKLEEAMAKVGEEGERFVRFLDSLSPQFRELAETSREGMFPGVTRGIREFMDLAPQLNRIIDQTAKGIGQLGRDAGGGLSGEGFEDFFNYLENEARPILVQFGRTIGNFAEGLANMIVAFGPLSGDFSEGLLEMSRSFVEWSDGLKSSTGFAEFVDYVREAGPLALDFLGSLSMAFVEILEAAAPIGSLMLPALTQMFDVIANLANTPLGPTIIGFAALTSAWGRLNALASITGSGVMAKATAGFRENLDAAKMLRPSLSELGTAAAYAGQGVQFQTKQTRLAITQTKAFAKAAAPIAGQMALFGVAASGVAGNMGLANTATLAMAGSLMGPWGAAAGAAIGLSMDLAQANDALTASMAGTREAIDAAFETKPGTADLDSVAAQYEAAYNAREAVRREIEAGGWAGVKARAEDLFGENDYEESYAEIKRLYDDLQVLRDREAEAARERAADQAYYNSIQRETEALEANIQKMREKRSEALAGMNADLDYAETLLNVAEAAEKNNGVLSKNGDLMGGPKQQQAGIDALRELNNLAGAWNNLSDKAQNTPGAYRGAIDAFVEAAEQMGIGERQARRMAREIMNIPTKWETRITLDADAAFRRARDFKKQLDALKDVDVAIHVSRRYTGGDLLPFLSGGTPKADGGTIEGARWPYGDKVLTPTAPGEEVISNRYGQADMNREALKAASAGAKIAVVGYADGGTIGGATGRSIAAGRSYPASRPSYAGTLGGAAIDYDRLTEAVLRARPLYGDVAISGDPSEWKRHMLNDEQAAGLGGFGG